MSRVDSIRPTRAVAALPARCRGRARLGKRCARAWLGALAFGLALIAANANAQVPSFSAATTQVAPAVDSPLLAPQTVRQTAQNYAAYPASYPALEAGASGDTLAPDEAAYDGALVSDQPVALCSTCSNDQWRWRLLPQGLIYRSYLAGAREPRAGAEWNYVLGRGWVWDFTMGARVGLLRYGDGSAVLPQGWQLDVEGAALGRLAFDRNLDLEATDYRAGLPLTYGRGRYATKFAFYHLSSHVGDEFLLTHPGFTRLNYSRNVLVWGHSWQLTDNLRLYGEAGYAVDNDGGSQPWEFQFGADYAPLYPTGFSGAPFLAFNGHLREEVDFGGQFTMHAGWAWRDDGPGRLFRTGLMYNNGKHRQLSFPFDYEHQVGLGAWYDF